MKRFATILTVMLVLTAAGCDDSFHEDETVEPAQDDTAKETITETFEPGMGKKGSGYGHGPVGTPLKAMHWAEESLVKSQITRALELYRGLNGDYPKTHEVFMKEIIEANMISLPELPEGQQYVYDPEDHQLKIEQPR